MCANRLYATATLLVLSAASPGLWAQVPTHTVAKGAEVLKAERMDVSRPLRD